MDSKTTNILIDLLGGTNACAALCETSAQAVSQWRTNGMPHARFMYLKAVRPKVVKEAIAKAAEQEIQGSTEALQPN